MERAFLLLPAVFLAAGTGCIRRELVIETNPPGAAVMVDRQPIGRSPRNAPFTYHGTRAITVTSAGRASTTVLHTLRARGPDVFPFDFVTDGLLPFTFTRTELVHITLPPRRPLTDAERAELRRRAEALRERGRKIVPVAAPVKGTAALPDEPTPPEDAPEPENPDTPETTPE
ncbi:MAG: PEGA domain-containing protein [Planctomycetota bacterium]